MDGNWVMPMDNPPTPPLQFSMGELTATVALTFAGMLIFKFLLSDMGELQLLFIVAVATWIAALSTMDGTYAHRRKLWRLVDRILTAWLAVFLFCWLVHSREFHSIFFTIVWFFCLIYIVAVTVKACQHN